MKIATALGVGLYFGYKIGKFVGTFKANLPDPEEFERRVNRLNDIFKDKTQQNAQPVTIQGETI